MKDKLSEALGVPVPKKRAGEGCTCGAYWRGECGCGADWTDPELVELRGKVAGLKRDMKSLQQDLKALGDENFDLLDIIDKLEGKSTSTSMWWGVVLVDGTIEVDHYHDDIEMYEAREKGTAKAIYGPFESLTCISAHMKIEELYENDNPTSSR